MTEGREELERDEVLFAFHQACERPTASQIIEWTERYPQFADDIREHAAVRRDWAAGSGEPALEPDEAMIARGRSQALNALYHSRQEAAGVDLSPSWQRLLGAAGFTVAQLARHIDIERMVLAELGGGRVRLPIGRRLVDALVLALGTTPDVRRARRATPPPGLREGRRFLPPLGNHPGSRGRKS